MKIHVNKKKEATTAGEGEREREGGRLREKLSEGRRVAAGDQASPEPSFLGLFPASNRERE